MSQRACNSDKAVKKSSIGECVNKTPNHYPENKSVVFMSNTTVILFVLS